MPRKRNVTIGYAWPKMENSIEFGKGNGDLWAMLADISNFLEDIVNDEVDFEDDEDKHSIEEVVRLQKSIATSLEGLINRRRITNGMNSDDSTSHTPNGDSSDDELSVSLEAKFSDLDDIFEGIEEMPRIDSTISTLPQIRSDAELDIQQLNLMQRVEHILETKSWAEAISETAAEMLIDTADRVKLKKYYGYSDTIKVLMVLFHTAGFKFVDPKTNDIARSFFERLFRAGRVRETPWLGTSPAKPFSSTSSNHPELMIRLHYSQAGSSREVTAYGLSEAGYKDFRSDIIKMGVWKYELDKIEELVREKVSVPSFYPEALQVDTDRAILQILD